MARTKAQKKEIVEKISKVIDGAKALVFVNVHGLKVADSTTMRRELKKNGVGFVVAKKTLTGLALKSKGFSGEVPELVGEFGMAYGADPVAPARGVYEFQKKFANQITIVGGVFESAYVSKEKMTEIASIPPLQTLYGMLANVINSPIQGLVMALDQISKKKS